jgi:4a-hydroxytetrahydrobiopterin dehydratase
MNQLAASHCVPLSGAPMDAKEIEINLARTPGWTLVDGAVEKHFRFANYYETLAFVNAVGWIANQEDHHPELRVTYDRCVVRFDTHSVGGISMNDFICAAKVEALFR